MDALLVFCNCPDNACAERLAGLLIEQRLAACVSVLPTCRSHYRWQGERCIDEEVPLLIKTCTDRYAQVETLLHAEHPYELPEILAVAPTHGLPGYLAWLAAETRLDNDE